MAKTKRIGAKATKVNAQAKLIKQRTRKLRRITKLANANATKAS